MFRRFTSQIFSKRFMLPFSLCTGIGLSTYYVYYRKNTHSIIYDSYQFNPKKPVEKYVMNDLSHYIDCTGLDPYDVFAHLYNSSKPLGLGYLHVEYTVMDKNEAKKILDVDYRTDYVNGRPIKIYFNNWPYLSPTGYDSRNGGEGTMKRLITELKETGKVCNKIPEKLSPEKIKEIVNHHNNEIQIFQSLIDKSKEVPTKEVLS